MVHSVKSTVPSRAVVLITGGDAGVGGDSTSAPRTFHTHPHKPSYTYFDIGGIEVSPLVAVKQLKHMLH